MAFELGAKNATKIVSLAPGSFVMISDSDVYLLPADTLA